MHINRNTTEVRVFLDGCNDPVFYRTGGNIDLLVCRRSLSPFKNLRHRCIAAWRTSPKPCVAWKIWIYNLSLTNSQLVGHISKQCKYIYIGSRHTSLEYLVWNILYTEGPKLNWEQNVPPWQPSLRRRQLSSQGLIWAVKTEIFGWNRKVEKETDKDELGGGKQNHGLAH